MRKNKFKIISIVVIFSILLTLIPIRNIIIKAENRSEPRFEITTLKADPRTSILGDEIEISGTIEPKSFEVNTLEQELVIILDISDKKNNSGNNIENISNDNNSNKIVNQLSLILKKLDNENLKIGIITYSDESKISLTNNKKLIPLSEFKKIDSKGSNNGNNGNGSKITNKNIGDALRQAIYLLNSDESNPNANKTILLIAEGETDTRRVYSDGNFCLDTTKENIENTQIVTYDSEKNLEYTKALGSIIKNKGYNVFTMGFDIDKKDGEKAAKQKDILKQIHSSMTGYTDLNNTNCEEKGLFLETRNPADNRSDIEIMFEDIINQFNSEYYLKNVNLNFEFNNDITLKSGENSIKLENIKYDIIANTAMYKGNIIKFSFVINAKKIGKQNVFRNLSIKYLWKNEEQVQYFTSNLDIIVQDNNYPNISATLREPYLTANPSDIITVQYDIEPKEILFNNLDFMKKEIGEVIFILDTSSKMDDAQRLTNSKNAITNRIINDTYFSDIKLGVITYDEYCYIGDRNVIDNPKNVDMKQSNNNINLLKPLFDMSDGNSKDGYRLLFQNDIIKVSNYKNRNLDNALNTAKYIFDKFGEKDKGKAIVLISSGKNNYSEDKINLIKNNGYKIISLDLSNEINTDLIKIHQNLGGIYSEEERLSDYIIGTFMDQQNYNNYENDMIKVAERLKSGVVDKDKFISPKFTFDLNNNFEYVEDSDDNISFVSNNDNKLEFTLNNPIQYSCSDEMVDGKYKFTAKEQTISFKVKVKDSKLPSLTFGSDTEYLSNYMSYNNFSKEEVKVELTTPVVKLIQKVSNVSHGLYNGIVNNKVEIKENENTVANGIINPLILAEKSTLVMGSTFNTSSNNIDVSLNIDDNFEVVKTNDIIVYKVINNNAVETLEIIKKVDNSSIDNSGYKIISSNGQTNKFNISINDFKDKNEDTKILIVYKGIIKDNISNKQLINKIEFGSGVFKDFIIDISTDTEESPKLPDLF